MLYIPCPHCGPRNETEFHYGAEAGVGYPDPNALSDTEWAKYLHIRANPRGWHAERWVHAPAAAGGSISGAIPLLMRSGRHGFPSPRNQNRQLTIHGRVRNDE